MKKHLFLSIITMLLASCIRTTIAPPNIPITTSYEQGGIFLNLNATTRNYTPDDGIPLMKFIIKNKGQKIQRFDLKKQTLLILTIQGEKFEKDFSLPTTYFTPQNKLILRKGDEISFSYKPEIPKKYLIGSQGVKIYATFPFLNKGGSLNLILKNRE